MSHSVGCLLLCAVALAALSGCQLEMETSVGANPNIGRVRHVVMFKFKDDAKPEQIDAVVKAFGELPKKIKQIRDYEWGVNNSPEGLNQGLTHCFFVTFDNEKDRDAYLPHPEHKAFVKILRPILDKVTVVDYVAKP